MRARWASTGASYPSAALTAVLTGTYAFYVLLTVGLLLAPFLPALLPGLAAAKALGGSTACRVTVIDRRNHHLFVPLLYQVATAALSPADIAEPIRKVLSRHDNIAVRLGTVSRVDTGGRRVLLEDGGEVPYDKLVLAPGSRDAYFGHPEWAVHAPGLRSLENAREIRRRVLLAFEQAEAGNVRAQYQLGFSLVGFTDVFSERQQEGFEWLLRAANAGFTLAEAEVGAAWVYGYFTQAPDPERARPYLERAAADGDRAAQLTLADLPARPDETPERYEARRTNLELLSASGCYPFAAIRVAVRLATGDGLPRDPMTARAIYWQLPLKYR